MKKLSFALALMISIIFATSVSAADLYDGYYDGTFSDISGSESYADSVYLLYDLYILDGNDDGTFAPDRVLNRAELSKLLINTALYDTNLEAPNSKCFDDVDLDTWYAPYVCSAKDNKYVKGDDNSNSFRPGETANVAEALSTLGDIFNWNATPSQDQQWFEPLFVKAEELNLLAADYRPSTPVTRAIFADMLAKGLVTYEMNLDEYSTDSYSTYVNYLDTNYELSAVSCEEYGVFDDQTGECIVECETDAECDAIFNEIDDFTAELEAEYYDFERDHTSEGSIDESLAVYAIDGNNISLKSGDQNSEHQQIWDSYSKLIAPDMRKDVVEYHIFSDGEGETLAYVEPLTDDPTKWIVAFDPVDSLSDPEEFAGTIIHEFAHVLTLRASQVPPIQTESDESYETEVENCMPRYYPGEGCSLTKSYINAFYQSFWKQHEKALEDINYIMDDDEYYNAIDNFYNEHQTEFVTEYAATNPGEDIAEAFTIFVITKRPAGNTLADQKVNFFYDFPELVNLRSRIRLGMTN